MNSSLRSSDNIFAAHSARLVLPRNLFKAVRITSKTIKKILPINSIPKDFQHSSTQATSRRSEIGRTSISGSFSLLLSFGDAKGRRERKRTVTRKKKSFGEEKERRERLAALLALRNPFFCCERVMIVCISTII
jgi:hypothetical protein